MVAPGLLGPWDLINSFFHVTNKLKSVNCVLCLGRQREVDRACSLRWRGMGGQARPLLSLPGPLAFPASSVKDLKRGLGVGVSMSVCLRQGGCMAEVWASLSNCVQLAWLQGDRSGAMVLRGQPRTPGRGGQSSTLS